MFAAGAVWLSSGAIAFRNPSGARIGVLPVGALPFAAAALVAVIVFAAGVRNARGAAVAVSPLALLVIPWLPAALPPAFLIWTGALAIPIWIGVAVALACAGSEDPAYARAGSDAAASSEHHCDSVRRVFRPGGSRDVAVAFCAGCVVFGAAAWSVSAAIPGGDEPHYLVITQSLLHDHDLNVENNYAQGDYREYYGGPLNPDFRVRGRHGELYSIHAPGVAALVLPAFALGGYRAVVAFLVLLSAAACALAWWLAWRAANSRSAAWFGWAVVVFSAPFLLESFTVYPDGPAAAIVLTAFWALLRLDPSMGSDRGQTGVRLVSDPSLTPWVPWILHGAALAALPWMHTRFALLALVLGLLILFRLVRTGNAARVPAFLAVPILSGIGWVAAAYAMYGTLNPAAAYGGQTDTSFAFLPDGLGGLLFDQGFGLIATAPALSIAFAGLLRTRRFAADWGLTALVYAVAVGSYAMWWAGTSGPARFLVPLLLPLALPAAAAWQAATSRAVRVLLLLTLGVTACLSAVLAGGSGGFLAYHSRNVYGMTPAPWLGWANPLVDLSQALPAFVPRPLGTPVGARMAAARDGFVSTVPWILCVTAAVYVTLWVGRTRARLHELVAAAVAALALAAMAASSIVWWMHGGQRGDPLNAQLNVLRRLSNGRALTLDLQNARRLSGVEALRLRLDIPTDDAVVPLLPAGSYVISTRGVLHAPLAIYAGADEEPFAIATAGSGDLTSGVPLDLPVMVRALMFRAPTFAGASAIEVRPIAPRLAAGSAYLSDVAHHAAAYGNTNVFFLDDRTAPEADGFWIWGSREGRVVFSSTSARPIVTLRNGAVRNDVTIRVGNDPEQQVALEPGEERQVSLPALYVDAAYLLTIRTSAGFRPSDVDPHSRDRRFLGVYVVMPDHAVR